MKKKIGKCRLCLRKDMLENSHIIPSFVFRWMKETSGTGFIRFGQTINRRSQDGHKDYWLCSRCEDLFSGWETEFASNVFRPLTSREASQFQYGDWLLKFAVSLSWRCLLYIRELTGLKHFSKELQQEADGALCTWSEFLIGQQSDPGKYEQHVLPLDEITDHTIRNLPPNINRYLLRSVEIDATYSGQEAFVYVKLPYLIFIGFINRQLKWEGTKIHINQGLLGGSNYSLPESFLNYMMDRARRVREIQQAISDRQRKKIDQSFRKNVSRFAESGTLKALNADVRLFGRDAFSESQEIT